MSIVRVTEVIAQSPQGFDEACQDAVRQVGETVRRIRSMWVKDLECVVDNNRITQYRVNAKVSFGVER